MFMKKQGTDTARLAWGMLALFASKTIISILKIEHVQGCVLFAQTPCYAPWTCSSGGGADAYLRLMAWIPPGSAVRLGGQASWLNVAHAFFGLSVKRAQRPVLRHVSRSMDLRSVRNRNRRHTPHQPVLLHPDPPRPLLPPAGEGEPSSCRVCKKIGDRPRAVGLRTACLVCVVDNRFDLENRTCSGVRVICSNSVLRALDMLVRRWR